jgi:DNA-directed RNA polymerase subunit RPC12/RpoP
MGMELRCPDCASPEVASRDREFPGAYCCFNCGARFQRASSLVTVADAEAIAATSAEPLTTGPFRFDLTAARRSIDEPDGAIWPVNAYSDADELHSLLSAAFDCDAILGPNARATLYIYPTALVESDPLIAVDPGCGPVLLSYGFRIRELEDEDPVEFTLRLLDEIVAEANQLLERLGSNRADALP